MRERERERERERQTETETEREIEKLSENEINFINESGLFCQRERLKGW